MAKPKRTSASRRDRAKDQRFPVVGVGASAGGLAAFEALVAAMPPDSRPGLAVVLVQHLAPDHKSLLTELVGRCTRMRAFEVADGMAAEPNCVYVIPPNREMTFSEGSFHLREPTTPRGNRLPIDLFFRSLAEDRHEQAIGIVLSGTGSDGALGLRAIKGEGGLTIAQSPETAEFEGMPRNAVATGVVDYVLAPAEIPAQLLAYLSRAFGRAPRTDATVVSRAEAGVLEKIFVLLRRQTGHDFSQYKRKTILRRIERRMAVEQIETIASYVQRLRQSPAEVDALFRDLLIGVTHFFRDGGMFEALESEVIPRLLRTEGAAEPVRIWVPGCSTGEEAFSIAILLRERMEACQMVAKPTIFATDIDPVALEHARAGLFPSSISSDLSSDRLARFFERQPESATFRIAKEIRDLLIFSEQDLIRDPPFSRLDLISCRNLLIYLESDLQKRVLSLFHYALNPGGFLVLGTSETIGQASDLFAPLDAKMKIYRSLAATGGGPRRGFGGFLWQGGVPRSLTLDARKERRFGQPRSRELTERALLREYAPPGALVDARGTIYFLHGRTGRFLEPTPGEAEMNVLGMAKEGFQPHLTIALRKASVSREPVRLSRLRIRTNGDLATVDLVVSPVEEASEAPLFLVTFEELSEAPPAPTTEIGETGAEAEGADARVEELRGALRAKEEYLQAALEAMETSNEELNAANEELQSLNEELQSTNEELETSKEELQSVNEELATVNTELEQRVRDLSQANNDMVNLLAGTGIGTIFLDHELNILRFTPAITQVLNLIPGDIGRPVDHIVSNLAGYDRLVEDVKRVLETLSPSELEVQTKDGAWYLLRIRPYRTLNNVIEGAVLTFFDITDLKQALEAAEEGESLRRLAVVVRDAYDALVVHGLDGRILAWNSGATRLYGWSETEALAMSFSRLLPEDARELEIPPFDATGNPVAVAPYHARRVSKSGDVLEVLVTASALVDGSGALYGVATTERLAPTPDP